jgi:hypothetical protein
VHTAIWKREIANKLLHGGYKDIERDGLWRCCVKLRQLQVIASQSNSC